MPDRIEQSRTPDLAELLRVVMDQALAELFVGMPGVVMKYNPVEQKADVQPLLNRAYVNIDGTEGQDILPVLPAVPVQFMRGGGYYASFPLAPGDNVLLLFMDRSIDNYLSGSGKKPVDPVDLRQHDISDAVAIPCGYPFSRAIKDDVSSGAVFGKEGGAQIRATGNAMEATTAGAPASTGGFVALAAKVDAFIQAFDAVMRAWVPVTQDGGAALKTAYTAAFSSPPTPSGSTNLKAD